MPFIRIGILINAFCISVLFAFQLFSHYCLSCVSLLLEFYFFIFRCCYCSHCVSTTIVVVKIFFFLQPYDFSLFWNRSRKIMHFFCRDSFCNAFSKFHNSNSCDEKKKYAAGRLFKF